MFFLIAGVAFITSAHGQSTKIKMDETELIRINHQFIKNFLNNDTVEHNKIIHPTQFLFIGKDGQLADRKSYMLGWSHGYNKESIPKFELADEQVRIFGDMALIVARTTDTTIKDGKLVNGETRYTDTYVRENGKWLCVQVQLTRIAARAN